VEFRREGFEPFPKSIRAKFSGVEDFDADFVAVRHGAEPVDPSLLDADDVIQLKINGSWIAYRRTEVRLADAKFGTGELNEWQLPADLALRKAGHEGIEKLNPPFADLPLDKFAVVLNRTKPFLDYNIRTSVEKLTEFGALLENGKTTLASFLLLIYLSEIPIDAWLADGDGQDESQ
jgi:hypothetical protein